MALVPERTANFVSYTGTPDAAYQTLDFGFKSAAVKIIVLVGSFDVSFNKASTPHMILLPGQYDFVSLEVGKIFVRDISAVGVQVLAWTI